MQSLNKKGVAEFKPQPYIYGFFMILIVVLLYTVLATKVGETSSDDDIRDSDSFSNSVNFLIANGTNASFFIPSGEFSISSYSAAVKNLTWLNFTGGSNHQISNFAFTSGGYSWSIWFNARTLTSAASNVPRNFLFSSTTGGPAHILEINQTAGVLQYRVINQTTLALTSISSSSAVNNSGWRHAVATLNGTNGVMNLYLDGVLINSTQFSGAPDSETLYNIGGDASVAGINASLDEVRSYSAILNDSDVLTLYNAGRTTEKGIIPKDSGNLTVYLKINEGGGTTVYDSSGNSDNGTFTGPVWASNNINVTLTDNTDYQFSSAGNFTLKNERYSFSNISLNYNYATLQDFGIHRNLLKLLAGFVAIMAFVFAAVTVIKIYREALGEKVVG